MKQTGLILSCLLVLILLSTGCRQEKAPAVISMTRPDMDLFFAVWRGDKAAIDDALQAGADINARHRGLMSAGALGEATPLFAAVFENKIEIVSHLLARGADPALPNDDGMTPIEQARKRGFDKIVAVLEKAEMQAKKDQPQGQSRADGGD